MDLRSQSTFKQKMKHFFAHLFPLYLSALSAVVVAWVAVFTVGPILDKYALQKEAEALKEEVIQLSEESIVLKKLIKTRINVADKLDEKNKNLQGKVFNIEQNNIILTKTINDLQETNKFEAEQNVQLGEVRKALEVETDKLQSIYVSHISELIALNVRKQLKNNFEIYKDIRINPVLMLGLLMREDHEVVTGRDLVQHALSSSELAIIPLQIHDKIREISNHYVNTHAALYDRNLRIPTFQRTKIFNKLPSEIQYISVGEFQRRNFGSYQKVWENAEKEVISEIMYIQDLTADVERSLDEFETAIISERKAITRLLE